MYAKFDGPSWNGSVSIVFTSFADRPTDRQTDGQTPAPYHNTSRQVGRIKIEVFGRIGAYFCLVSIGRGRGQAKYFYRWRIYISLYTHKVLCLSTTSLYTNWAKNNKKTGHFQQKYWKSRKMAHFVTSMWRHRGCHEIFNTHS